MAFIALVASLPAVAHAQHWTCWYQPSREHVIVCERDLAREEPAVAVAARSQPPAGPAWESGPLRRFRAIDERVVIPLHAKPTDLSRLEVLARDVLCGRGAGCELDFSRPRILRAGAD